MSHRDFANILGVAARLDQEAMARSSAGLPPDYYARDPVECTNPDCRKLTYGATLAGYLWRDCCQTCIDNLYDEFKAKGRPDERVEDPEPFDEFTGPLAEELPHGPNCWCPDCDDRRHHERVDDDEVRKHRRG